MALTRSLANVAADLLVVGVAPDGLEAALDSLPEAFRSALLEATEADSFTGKLASTASYATFGQIAAPHLLLVGIGDGSAAALRRAAGKAGHAARARGSAAVVLAVPDADHSSLDALWEAFWEGNYRFDKYKAEDARKAPTASLEILLEGEPSALSRAVRTGQDLARDLVSEPAAVIYPESLAQVARDIAGLDVDVWDMDRLQAAGMGGIVAVGQGSSRPPRLIHMIWKPKGAARRRIALVGKGVTFDAGGLSIKPTSGMLTMRCDMAGSAAVVGAMRAIAELQPDVEVHGIIGAAENMLGGNAFKLGDVLSMYSGKTVEVHNTDAEGRLCLADCLALASELGVDAVVDVATLTGACVVALGTDYSGLFTGDDALASTLMGHAIEGGELLWRLPLPDSYKDLLKAEWGTIKNVGGRYAGASTAALFLSEFVDGPAWAHIDIAGPSFHDKTHQHWAPGGTGVMVSTLTRWAIS